MCRNKSENTSYYWWWEFSIYLYKLAVCDCGCVRLSQNLLDVYGGVTQLKGYPYSREKGKVGKVWNFCICVVNPWNWGPSMKNCHMFWKTQSILYLWSCSCMYLQWLHVYRNMGSFSLFPNSFDILAFWGKGLKKVLNYSIFKVWQTWIKMNLACNSSIVWILL